MWKLENDDSTAGERKKTEGSWQDEVLSLSVNLRVGKQMKAVMKQTEKSYSASK